MRPAVFFDRDNTLIVADGYLGDPAGVVLADGAADAVARAHRLGFAVVVVSNQSGVGRGHYGEDDVRAVDARMAELLLADDPAATIDGHYFCPHHPVAAVEQYRRACDCRKPRPGLLLRAAAELDLDLSKSWMVGDAPRDVEAGHAAGCRAVLLRDPSVSASPAASEPSDATPEHMASSLAGAVDFIARAGRDGSPAERPTVARPAPPESVDRQILAELRKLNDHFYLHGSDFSVAVLIAGVVQVLAVASAFLGLLNWSNPAAVTWLLLGIFLQAVVATLAVFGR